MEPTGKKYKVGFALSGGGARGIAHLGVLKAFDEAGIKPEVISGVSSGAIIGAMYACGYRPDDILKIISTTRVRKIIRLSFSKFGLFNLNAIQKLLIEYIPSADFSALKIDLFVSALNIRIGKINYFNQGDLIKPIIASSSVPLLFNPVVINGEQYVDGGLIENLPITPIRKETEYVVAVHTNPVDDNYQQASSRKYLERILLLAINRNSSFSFKDTDMLIEPPGLKKLSASALKDAPQMFDIAYNYTSELLQNFKLPENGELKAIKEEKHI